jgi:signal transduction histidine kinase
MGGSFEIDSSEKGTSIQVALLLPASAESGTG